MGPEAKIENPACDYAERLGFEHRKLKWVGRRDAPDRIFWREEPPVRPFVIEFKAPKKEPRSGQRREIYSLKLSGMDAYICDDLDEAKRIINAHAK